MTGWKQMTDVYLIQFVHSGITLMIGSVEQSLAIQYLNHPKKEGCWRIEAFGCKSSLDIEHPMICKTRYITTMDNKVDCQSEFNNPILKLRSFCSAPSWQYLQPLLTRRVPSTSCNYFIKVEMKNDPFRRRQMDVVTARHQTSSNLNC